MKSAGCGGSITFHVAVIMQARPQAGQVRASGAGPQDRGVAGDMEHVGDEPIRLHSGNALDLFRERQVDARWATRPSRA